MTKPTKVVFSGTSFAGSSSWNGSPNTSVLLTSANAVSWTTVNTVSDPSGGYQGTDLDQNPLANEFGFRRALTLSQVTIPVPAQGTMNSTAYAQLVSDISNANTEIQNMRVQYYGEGTRLPGGTDWIIASGTDANTTTGWKSIAVRTNSSVAAVQDEEGVWIPKTLPVSAPWSCAAINDGHIMLVAGTADAASRIALMSSDAENWQTVYVGGAARHWRDITPHQDKFIVMPGITTDSENLTFSNPPAGLQSGNGFSVPVTSVNDDGVLVTLGTIVGGSGYTNGTYNDVALVGSKSGATNARATITVTGGAVTGCVLSFTGSYYIGPNTSNRAWVWDQDAYTNNENLVFYATGLAAGLAAGSGFSVDLIEAGVNSGVWTGVITPGSGYTNGTYTGVRLLGTVSNANNMEATITVTGGVVTGCVITAEGTGYISPPGSNRRQSGVLPAAADWRSVTSNGEYALALRSGSNSAARSTNGTTWASVNMPTGTDWVAAGTGWRTSTHNFTITPSATHTYSDMPIFKVYSPRVLTNRATTTVSGTGSNATFNVTIESGCYTDVTLSNAGTGYSVGSVLEIDGGLLDGTTLPAGVGGTITINVTGISGVYGAGPISTFTWSGTPKNTFYPLDIAGGYQGTVNITANGTSYTNVTVNNAGEEYGIGQQYIVPGWALNGSDNTNNNSVTFTITGVNSNTFPGITTINPVLTNPAIARTNITGTITRTHNFSNGTANITNITITQSSPVINLNEQFTIPGATIGGSSSNDVILRASAVNGVQVTANKNSDVGTLQTLVYNSGTVPRAVMIATRSSASSSIARSVDSGQTWTTQSLPSSQVWTAVSSTRGRMVVASPNTTAAATSTDALTWSSNTLVESQPWANIIFDGTRFIMNGTDRYPLIRQYGVDSAWRRYQDEYLSDWTVTTINTLSKTTGTQIVAFGTGTLRLLSSLLSNSGSGNLDQLIIDANTTSQQAQTYLNAAWRNRNLMWILSDSSGNINTAKIFPVTPSVTITSSAWTGTQILATDTSKLYSVPVSISTSNYTLIEEGNSTTFGSAITGLNVVGNILYVATDTKTWTATL